MTKSNKISKCNWCNYEGFTDYYRMKHHCFKCNRLVKIKKCPICNQELEKCIKEVKNKYKIK